MKQLFIRHYKPLKETQLIDESTSIFIYIIEEYVLLEFIISKDFKCWLNFALQRFKIAQNKAKYDTMIALKNSCLSLVTTQILILFQSNNPSFKDYKVS